jgi:hypothetical protein
MPWGTPFVRSRTGPTSEASVGGSLEAPSRFCWPIFILIEVPWDGNDAQRVEVGVWKDTWSRC